MKILNCLIYVQASLLALFLVSAEASTNVISGFESKKIISNENFNTLTFSTPAYRSEALRLIISEANQVAQELRLHEQLPITRSSIVAAYISPPRIAQYNKGIGNITTSNYTYYISVDSKFSYLTQAKLAESYGQLQSRYLWPFYKINTNGAYELAVDYLKDVSMDVNSLDRDCVVHIDPFIPEGEYGKHFVPIYWVYWMPKDSQVLGPVAEVELFYPTKTLRQLRVNQSQYILRRSLAITNVDYLLSLTNDIELPIQN